MKDDHRNSAAADVPEPQAQHEDEEPGACFGSTTFSDLSGFHSVPDSWFPGRSRVRATNPYGVWAAVGAVVCLGALVLWVLSHVVRG